MRKFCLSCLLLVTLCRSDAADLVYRKEFVRHLVDQVPQILKDYDPETGHFGTGIWICRDQQVIYPLAVAYTRNDPDNPYYHDPEILKTIIRGGDALIEDADEEGKWMFRKKDGSEWGMIWMPWTYSRWVRAYALIRDEMPEEARQRWEKALKLGYSGIREHAFGSLRNIPAHHAMGLYVAGQSLDEPEWCRFASEFLRKVADSQNPAGYWSENAGPVVTYNFVYTDALGTYYSLSKDPKVLPALERCASYHLHFTYPDGTDVETIDERNPYHHRVGIGNVGFTMTPEGRAYLDRQWRVYGRDRLGADQYASLILYGEEGEMASPNREESPVFLLSEGESAKALTYRKEPWFFCLSAYTAPVPKSRWFQDRQNLVSLFHDRTGLLFGGGNTKLQPAWSNFVVGDPSLLAHRPGDENPDFLPKGELYHTPSSATLVTEPKVGLDLQYGPVEGSIRLDPVDENRLVYTVSAQSHTSLPVYAHLVLLPDLEKPLRMACGTVIDLKNEEGVWEELGGWVDHRGARIFLPGEASLIWPALPHNPYRKDGHAGKEEGRISIRIPLDKEHPSRDIRVEIGPRQE